MSEMENNKGREYNPIVVVAILIMIVSTLISFYFLFFYGKESKKEDLLVPVENQTEVKNETVPAVMNKTVSENITESNETTEANKTKDDCEVCNEECSKKEGLSCANDKEILGYSVDNLNIIDVYEGKSSEIEDMYFKLALLNNNIYIFYDGNISFGTYKKDSSNLLLTEKARNNNDVCIYTTDLENRTFIVNGNELTGSYSIESKIYKYTIIKTTDEETKTFLFDRIVNFNNGFLNCLNVD